MITNVGKLLRKERENQNISLETVEKETRIRKKNLEAIENEAWDMFPSRTYIQGIIKRYGVFLGLDEEKLAAYFRREYEQLENVRFKKKAVKNQFIPFSKRVVQAATAGIIFAFLIFFGYQLYLFNKPPKITITAPERTVFKRESKITIRGTAPAETIVEVNGQQAILDDQNRFEADVPLTQEKNTVTIIATGANGKKTTITKEYIKQE